ncbi:MAG: Diguanylate cyclase [Leptospirillum sp. Group IV 'UBA BS']|nr:MAG: Diguanylate cyclase [Leptospirillum sp. Group IV 'UBA BS']
MGDSVLVDVTGAIGKTLRAGDGFGRYGGEEFVVVLPGLGKARATLIAERIRNAVKKIVHPVAGKITLSIGVASYPEDVSRESELIPLADRMMYEAKRSGRDRVQTR